MVNAKQFTGAMIFGILVLTILNLGFSSAITTDGLLAYYDLDESSGTTAADSHGSGNDGTAGSGIMDGSSGILTNAANLVSNTNTIDMGSNLSDTIGSGDFTINMWMYINTNDGTARRPLYAGGDALRS